ncbi:MAG: hypothetical protein Q9213_003734 [Squamulea squamosa]
MCIQTQIFHQCTCPPPSPLTSPCPQAPNCTRIAKRQWSINGVCPVCSGTPTPIPWPFVLSNLPYTEQILAPQPTRYRGRRVEGWLNSGGGDVQRTHQVPFDNVRRGRGGIGGAVFGNRAVNERVEGVIARRKRVLSVGEMLNPDDGEAAAKGGGGSSSRAPGFKARGDACRVIEAVGRKRPGLGIDSQLGKCRKR